MANTQEIDPNSRNLIGQGTTITGEVVSDGVIRLDGALNGNLSTKAKVVIGKSGSIKGDLHSKNADISGTVEGKIMVEEHLTLKDTSKVKGEIYTNKLSIEPGATFDGSCDMSGNKPQQPRSNSAGTPSGTNHDTTGQRQKEKGK